MARTSEVLTPQEIRAFQEFAKEKNLVMEGDAGEKNGNHIAEYICVTWGQDITEATLAVALEKLHDRLTFLTQDEISFNAAKAVNPEAAEYLGANYAAHKLSEIPEQKLENIKFLAEKLIGRPVNYATVENEILRAGADTSRFHKHHIIHFSEEAKQLNVRQKPVDADYKPGQLFSAKDSNKSNADYARERAEAAAKDNPKPADSAKVLEEAARVQAAELKGDSHSDSDQLQRLFIFRPGTSEISWRDTLAARKDFQTRLRKSRETKFVTR